MAEQEVGAAESFPRQSARTHRFTRGAPRAFTVTGDERQVLFLRSRHGTDRVSCLWSLDVASGEEQLVVDAAALLATGDEELSVTERARRERAREAAGGVVAYATDRDGRYAVFALSSRLWIADLSRSAEFADNAAVRELPATRPVLDPRIDPTGHSIVYVGGCSLRVVAHDGSMERVLAQPGGAGDGARAHITWGLAEFVAMEEMRRSRGYWWAPDGTAVLAARVDESPVQRWHIADPANPALPPVSVAYPAAGTANAEVSLHLLALDGTRRDVPWDVQRFPYLVTVTWTAYGAPLVLVMSRDQRRAQILAVDVETGQTQLLQDDHDDTWLDVVPGIPAWLPDGRLVRTIDSGGARRLVIDGDAATPGEVQVSEVLVVDEEGVLFAGTDDPTEAHLWRLSGDGDLSRLTDAGAFHTGTGAGAIVVRTTRTLEEPGATTTVLHRGTAVAEIGSSAQRPVIRAEPTLFTVGALGLRVGLLLPRGHVPGTSLPVLMDPYGGPHAQQVLRIHDMWLEPQWLADQGFAVVVADGRGTGSRGPEWDRAVAGSLADVPLADQVEALLAVAELVPDLDLARVGIRGWSFGGYLAAVAVLRRPDVFSAAIAGAPVTDWRLYDTFYTERYLGHPDERPDAYDANSLLRDAPGLDRPLLLIHGLADDNVVAAHTLRLSATLLAAGRAHDVLPLSGVTHMTPQEVVAENLLVLQVQWLHRALGTASAS